MSIAPTSPYKGLNAFEDTELDALLFFGRERETEIVVANLIASRLSVLYGPSGVGKTSLLRAAVARSSGPRLERSSRRPMLRRGSGRARHLGVGRRAVPPAPCSPW